MQLVMKKRGQRMLKKFTQGDEKSINHEFIYLFKRIQTDLFIYLKSLIRHINLQNRFYSY